MPRYDTYFLMKEADVIDYVQTKYPGHFDKDAALTVKEIGDGNLNYVFRVVEEKTSIPHFYLEAEFWNSGRYSPEDRLSMIRSICNCLKITGIAEGK